MSDIKVSICCLAYNHELYIRQCLGGFLMQKCNFKFEVLIHDDASIDKTASIIKEYQTEYPDIIIPIYQTENQYSKGVKPTFAFNLPRIKGKYIALCEGDDYWTDPLKLQRQVDFLEENSEYVGVFTDFDKLNEQSGHIKNDFNRHSRKINQERDISMNHLFSNDIKYLRTLTSIFRACVLKEFEFYFIHAAGDSQLVFHALHKGKIRYFNYSTGVYRVLNESASHSKSFTKKQLFLENYVSFLHAINSRYTLHRREIRYIKKMTMMAKLRQEAHLKKLHSVCLISIKLILHLHFSRNVLRNIKYAFRKNK